MRLAVAVLISLGGCTSSTPEVSAAVEPGRTPTELTFRLTSRRADEEPRLEQLVVAGAAAGGRYEPGQPAYWAILRHRDEAPLALPATIRYGEPPPGFSVARRPMMLPLPPGRYELFIRTARSRTKAYFQVGTDGRVEPSTGPI